MTKRPKTLLWPITTHHNNAKWIWGSNHTDNKTELFQKHHRGFHSIFTTLPPHMILKYVIKLGCKSLTDEVKDSLIEILDHEEPINLYKPSTIKNKEKFIEAIKKAWRVETINY